MVSAATLVQKGKTSKPELSWKVVERVRQSIIAAFNEMSRLEYIMQHNSERLATHIN
jgi:hypothetical protein